MFIIGLLYLQICSFWVEKLIMKKILPEISRQIYSNSILNLFDKNYFEIGPIWASLQLEWLNEVYRTFYDYEKFMVLVYFRNKTFDYYSKNFVKMTFEEYYSQKMIEIEKFNIMDVSKNLNIPKESARRKIIELEKLGIIKRSRKKVYLLKSNWPSIKPEDNVKRISKFLSKISKSLYMEKVLSNTYTTEEISNGIKVNFSHIWKLYYDMQIPMLLKYKKIFKDLESFHVNGVCIVNQFLNSKVQDNSQMSKEYFLYKYMFKRKIFKGISAMSISDITGIPRPTVIRKLNKLVKYDFLNIDFKKHYTVSGNHKDELIEVQKGVFENLAIFSSKIFNLLSAQKKFS